MHELPAAFPRLELQELSPLLPYSLAAKL